MSTEFQFNYQRAFSRNLGWVNKEEQGRINSTVIAIPGLGGVGGHHLHSLLRVGFSKFKIADFDTFDVHNFNRQLGSNMKTVGVEKIEVAKAMALEINPECSVEKFSEGITKENYKDFLQGVDIVVDGLDVFQIDLRILLYEYAHEIGVPVVTAAPLGMGTSYLSFNPRGMSFNQYFNLNTELDSNEKLVRFLAGLAPKGLHLSYMKYTEFINIEKQDVPSLHIGCLAATSAVASVCTKMVLNRGRIIWAPRGVHTDFFKNKTSTFWRPWGNKNPVQKLIMALVRRKFSKVLK
jgi:molybdopterin/thiamine biosynthesis adenylyltransferase